MIFGICRMKIYIGPIENTIKCNHISPEDRSPKHSGDSEIFNYNQSYMKENCGLGHLLNMKEVVLRLSCIACFSQEAQYNTNQT